MFNFAMYKRLVSLMTPEGKSENGFEADTLRDLAKLATSASHRGIKTSMSTK